MHSSLRWQCVRTQKSIPVLRLWIISYKFPGFWPNQALSLLSSKRVWITWGRLRQSIPLKKIKQSTRCVQLSSVLLTMYVILHQAYCIGLQGIKLFMWIGIRLNLDQQRQNQWFWVEGGGQTTDKDSLFTRACVSDVLHAQIVYQHQPHQVH